MPSLHRKLKLWLRNRRSLEFKRRKRGDSFFCSNRERRKRGDSFFCSNRERRKRGDSFFCRNRTSNSLTPSQTSLEPETSTRFSLRFPERMDINMDMESRGILDSWINMTQQTDTQHKLNDKLFSEA